MCSLSSPSCDIGAALLCRLSGCLWNSRGVYVSAWRGCCGVDMPLVLLRWSKGAFRAAKCALWRSGCACALGGHRAGQEQDQGHGDNDTFHDVSILPGLAARLGLWIQSHGAGTGVPCPMPKQIRLRGSPYAVGTYKLWFADPSAMQ